MLSCFHTTQMILHTIRVGYHTTYTVVPWISSQWVLYHNSLIFSSLGTYPIYWAPTMCQLSYVQNY